MPTQQFLHVRAAPDSDRLNPSNDLSSTDDGEALAAVLDRVEQIRETPCRVGRRNVRHVNQII